MVRYQHSSGVTPKKSVPARGLLGDLDGREFDARRDGRLQTAQILKTGRTPLQVIEVAERQLGWQKT